ncbi:PQ-loop repeat-containing protein [Streptococcus ruminantium]|uniref:PQ-loop repeat-containing protein n=1 Tax=Streptococcus ruminantium TaxID=1917441 RepID=A0ABU1B7K2_9STRE|nr:PQ-loop repeat-containing protein [Streptococcus ruminantium]MDQ8759078.1 PQ-loop repeat-containing protein [Streptococcus ruminantium]MDQ8769634.1 PQ-loop repeat-containing protein [Streptococcus ruminantium]MDQ8775545.1 PQ-loop repeat-containing protein [Streptococcus ruminantium]MDQ8794439.1 PQ-loop repeat-containing protein [Streptococcus ruminantium]MDQ8796674.1 PQ-loop repeat-containing protein [Streptococcus ruminantium]
MKDYIKDGLMFFVSFTTYVSFVPQIVKLYKTKCSEDISVFSWVLWVSSSFAYLIFSLLEGGFGLVFASGSEFVLTTWVLVLSWTYRKKGDL